MPPRPDKKSPSLPERGHLSRLDHVWRESPLYFLTVCLHERKPLLVVPELAPLLIQSWRETEAHHGWTVGRYVVMPDHVHFIARPRYKAKSLPDFMRDWKKWTTRQLLSATVGSSTRGEAPDRIWQREYFDHVLRSPESYSAKWDYVRQNPVRAGLVARAEDWPLSGEINPLEF